MCEIEGNYKFDFGNFKYEKFDKKGNTVQGLLAVDFVVETDTHLLFIEIKDFDELKVKIDNTQDEIEKEKLKQHFKIRSKDDLEKLKINKDKSNEDSVALFRTQIGGKFKDSVLRKYVSGYKFEKPIKYIFILQFDFYGKPERERLREAILGYIPTFNEIKSKQIQIENFKIKNIKEFSKDYFQTELNY